MKINKTIILIFSIIIIIGGVVWFNSQRADKLAINSDGLTLKTEQMAILDATHIQDGVTVNDYNSNPPTSGRHYGRQADWGVYNEPIPDEFAVHNLEHGGIWISYKNIDSQTKINLESIASKYNQAVILTPRPDNDSNIVLASWGRLMQLNIYDQTKIENYIKTYINNSPEKFAKITVSDARVARNALAPDATFTTLDGKTMNLSQFKGKKVMFWVFATWCPSCIAGAQVLEQKNDQLGNLTVMALKTFGNAGFSGPTVAQFAEKNSPSLLSASNWLWGKASQEATQIYNPKNFPDIYFLIDEDGVLRDIDGAPAATINKIINFANE